MTSNLYINAKNRNAVARTDKRRKTPAFSNGNKNEHCINVLKCEIPRSKFSSQRTKRFDF